MKSGRRKRRERRDNNKSSAGLYRRNRFQEVIEGKFWAYRVDQRSLDPTTDDLIIVSAELFLDLRRSNIDYGKYKGAIRWITGREPEELLPSRSRINWQAYIDANLRRERIYRVSTDLTKEMLMIFARELATKITITP